jgi:malate dehydrogenase (quinone)
MAGKNKKMIPSHGQDLNDNPALSKLEKNTATVLKLNN